MRAHRRRRDDQVVLSPARDEFTIPIAIPATPRRRPSSRRSAEAYDCLKDPQKRAAYDRYRPCRLPAGRRWRRTGPGLRGLLRHLRERLRRFHGRRRGSSAAASAAAPTCATISRSASRRRSTARPAESASTSPRPASVCDGTGAKPGTSAATCTHLRRPRQGARAAGLLRGRARLPDLPRRGPGDRRSLPRLPRRGPGRQGEDARGQHPRRASTRARASASPARARPAAAARPPGDLYIFLHVKPPRHVRARGHHAGRRARRSASPRPRSAARSRCRGIDGETTTISIPAGIQSGKQLRQRGSGMPVLNQRGRGDLVIEIAVETPTRLSARQKELLAAVPRDRDGRGIARIARASSSSSRACSGSSLSPRLSGRGV